MSTTLYCAYGCAKLQGSSLVTHGNSKRSFQRLHTTKTTFSSACMLRQDTLTVLEVQPILRDKTEGLRGHVEVIWNNIF